MISEGTRQVDLYDFISVFVPGAAFLVAISPLFPPGVFDELYLLLAVLLVGGFIVGRWFHAVGLHIENQTSVDSHRGLFVSELKSPSKIEGSLVDGFYRQCCEMFPDSLPPVRPGSDEYSEEQPDAEAVADTTYVLARSAVHMDGRGRSRSFQAVLDFYRSMFVISAALGVIYPAYALNLILGTPIFGIGYQTFLSTLGIPPYAIYIGSVGIFIPTYMLFLNVRLGYRKYYVQYLMADFVNLSNHD